MDRTLIRDALAAPPGSELTLAGWVRMLRSSKGGFSFIALSDGSCFSAIQVVADGKLANYDSEVARLTPGSSVVVTGKLVASPAKGQ